MKETYMDRDELVAADILPSEEYAKRRTEHQRRATARKRNRKGRGRAVRDVLFQIL